MTFKKKKKMFVSFDVRRRRRRRRFVASVELLVIFSFQGPGLEALTLTMGTCKSCTCKI